MIKYRPIVGVVLALGIILAGCDSVNAPAGDQAVQPALSSAISSSSVLSKTDEEYMALTKPGFFTVCKEASDDPNQEFEFVTTAVSSVEGQDPTNTPVSPVLLKDGECVDVYEAIDFGTPADIVTITETVPEGWVSPPELKVWTINTDISDMPVYDPHDPAASITGTIDRGKIGCLVVFVNSKMRDAGGCTPGFWKNNAEKHDASAWPSDISPDDSFQEYWPAGPDITLLEALKLGGGGLNALARHAVAALLNASTQDYGLTVAEILEAGNNAILSGDSYVIESLKDTLDELNNQGCAFNQHGELESEYEEDHD